MSEGETNPGFVPDLDADTEVNGSCAKIIANNNRQNESDHWDDGVVVVVPHKIQATNPNEWNFNFTRRQWTFLLIFGVTNIFRATTILITFPFYPPEVFYPINKVKSRIIHA
jgi:hypothetical protein